MINVAILGFGTVGGGVAELLDANRDQVARAAGDRVRVKHILVRRDFPGSRYAELMTHDVGTILNDPEVSVVCEAMGGLDPALPYVRSALEHGKSVTTSNKELIDAHGPELAAVARAHGLSLLFEGSVAGGIPILSTIRDACAHERFDSAVGILNGTCNYILTRMEREGLSLAEALRQAQENGYAERNPDADVLGHDTARKLAILASLLSGTRISSAQVPCEGIMGLEAVDLRLARALRCSLKLLGVCRMDAGGLSLRTAPYLVPASSPLYGVHDVYNGVLLHSATLGDLTLCGRGAGRFPTASAVVSDVVQCARNRGRTVECGLTGQEARLAGEPAAEGRNLIRVAPSEAPLAREVFVGMEEVALDDAPQDFALLTRPMTERRCCEALAKLSTLRSRIRLLEAGA